MFCRARRLGPHSICSGGVAYSSASRPAGGAKTTEVNSKQLGTLSSGTSLVTSTIGAQRCGLQRSDHQLCALLLHLRKLDQQCRRLHTEKPAGAARHDIQRHQVEVERGPRGRAGLSAPVHLGREDVQRQPALPPLTRRNSTTRPTYSTKSIKGRAAAHGFTFVDPRQAFLSHEVCSSSEWLNGQSNPLSESYHPNVSGQADFTTQVEAVLP